MRGVRIAEARAALSAAFTAQIEQAFAHAHTHTEPARMSEGVRVPAFRAGPPGPGHDPRRVPVVPAAEVEIRRDVRHHDDRRGDGRGDGRDDGAARVAFTYKVEYGHPPSVVLHVRPDWLGAVARPGHVLLGGWAVLEVTDRDLGGRPSQVRVAVIGGFFDPTMHGWRAHADTHHAHVSWDPEHPDLPAVELGARIR